MTRATAIVPVRRFDRAKSRLGGCLGAPARRRLAARLLDHVLGALAASGAKPRVLVVTDGDEVADAARARGAAALREPQALGLRGAVEAGLDAAGAGPRLVLMADLPCLAPGDVDALLAAAESAGVALAPDLRGADTNGLSLREGAALRTFFGTGGSLGKHAAEAARRGLTAATVRRPGLALDLDIESDLAAALALGAGGVAGLAGELQPAIGSRLAR